MKKLSKIWAIWTSVEAVILLVGGIFLMVYGGDVNFQNAIGIIIAMFVILDGGLRILAQFMEKEKTFSTIVSGVIELALGIFICIEPDRIIGYISIYIAVLVFVIAALLFADAVIRLIRKAGKMPLSISEIILGLILAVGGVLIFYYQEEARQIILMTIGGLIIAGSLIEFGVVIHAVWVFNKNAREEEKVAKNEEKERKVHEKEAVNAKVVEKEEIKEIEATDVKEIENKK
jgi:hypothetical protein